MNDNLYELLLKLPKRNLVNIMWEALDEMQAFNGRTRTFCIMSAIGAKNTEEGKYKIPSINEIKKHTENMGL